MARAARQSFRIRRRAPFITSISSWILARSQDLTHMAVVPELPKQAVPEIGSTAAVEHIHGTQWSCHALRTRTRCPPTMFGPYVSMPGLGGYKSAKNGPGASPLSFKS